MDPKLVLQSEDISKGKGAINVVKFQFYSSASQVSMYDMVVDLL